MWWGITHDDDGEEKNPRKKAKAKCIIYVHILFIWFDVNSFHRAREKFHLQDERLGERKKKLITRWCIMHVCLLITVCFLRSQASYKSFCRLFINTEFSQAKKWLSWMFLLHPHRTPFCINYAVQRGKPIHHHNAHLMKRTLSLLKFIFLPSNTLSRGL